MNAYAGIDLHANNSFIGITDETDRRLFGGRCPNEQDRIFEILVETGPVERFGWPGEYASYCRCVPSAYWSNEKKKGSGNKKNGNKYLSWAYAEAAAFCIRFCDEAKRYYQRKCASKNQPVAYRAISNKMAKACYFIMRDGAEFDAVRLFG